MSINEEPNNDKHHWRALCQMSATPLYPFDETQTPESRTGKSHIDKRGPVHLLERQILSADARKTQDRQHDNNKTARGDTRGQAGGAEVPGPAAELVADEGDLEEDGHGEGDVGGDGANAENGVDGSAAEDEQQ